MRKTNMKFHNACSDGELETVRKMIQSFPNLDVNVRDIDGWTPIYAACWHGRLEIIRELIESFPNLDVNVKNNYGSTPIYTACRDGLLEIVRELIESFPNLSINIRNIDGSTPLHIACKHNYVKTTELLMMANADTSVLDNKNKSPFDIAIMNRSIRCLNLMTMFEVDPGNYQSFATREIDRSMEKRIDRIVTIDFIPEITNYTFSLSC